MTDPRFSIIPAAAVTDPSLEGRDLQVLCLFGRHIDTNGWCRRSQAKMAKELGCARSTVQASIDRLVTSGWLQKRSDNEPHTPGIRDSAFEYRVLLDIPDVVGTRADRSAPPADDFQNESPEGPENGHRHPPAPPAALENTGVTGVRKAFSSAPMLTTPLNEKKEAHTRSGPTERPVLDDGKVRLHMDDPVFREIVRLRRNKHPPTDREGFWAFPPEIVAQAEANLKAHTPKQAAA